MCVRVLVRACVAQCETVKERESVRVRACVAQCERERERERERDNCCILNRLRF